MDINISPYFLSLPLFLSEEIGLWFFLAFLGIYSYENHIILKQIFSFCPSLCK